MFSVESDFTPSSFVVGLSPGLHVAQGLRAVWHLEAEPTGEGLVASDLACAVGAELERWPRSGFPISKSSGKSYFFLLFLSKPLGLSLLLLRSYCSSASFTPLIL